MPRYAVYDVFTDRRFAGNPLAVVIDGPMVPDDALQAVAREFGFSETTFVFPPDDDATTARVRIFTPQAELPFAGHPIIGTAIALADDGGATGQTLGLGIGPVRTTVTRGRDGAPARASFGMRQRLDRRDWPDAALAAAVGGLAPGDIAGPVEIASVGLPFLMVPLGDADALDRAVPDRAAALRLAGAGGPVGVLFYVRDGSSVAQRMFAPTEGIDEDPATGSATAALGALLAARDDAPLTLSVAQGVAVGRASDIEVTAAPSGDGLTDIRVSGAAVRVMEGRLTL